MYSISTEAAFDSAHFLSGYNGKCSNIHGHRFNITAEIYSETLEENGQLRGMIVDFGVFKRNLSEIADNFDHALIYEDGTLKVSTIKALEDEGFKLIPVDFRPTAENFAKCIYDKLCETGYNVKCVTVHETPNNSASYSK